MMDAVMAFAATRKERMVRSDEDLTPLVAEALARWSADGEWYADLVEGASVLWQEIFLAEAPRADAERFMPRFQEMLTEALAKTSQPHDSPTEGEVNRVTYWLSTATINNATYWGNQAHGGSGMRWVTMNDDDVRGTHRAANGQIADSDGTFDIGGFELHYPGEPVGPPEIWINCRCILAPARVEGALTIMPNAITADMAGVIADNDEVDSMPEGDLEDEELPIDEPEDDEEEITEIPVHGVAAIEGRPTGDGRKFAIGSVSIGALPQPLGFEFESSHGGGNSRVAVVGRIDEFFKVEVDGIVEVRWRGVIFPGKQYASQAIEGIIDGSYTGLSIIADSMALDVEATEADAEATADGHILVQTLSEVRIRRFDMVPTGAYQEGWINLGHEFADELDEEALAACAECAERAANGPEDDDDNPSIELGYDLTEAAFAPGTKDGPGWITHPIPTGRIRRYWTHGKGAGKIRWGAPGDFNRCRRQLAKYIANPEWLAGACANMHKEVLGVWPGQESGRRGFDTGGTAMPITAAAAVVATKPAEAFADPEFTEPTPLTIEGDRIFGHLAAWGVCHIGIQDQCVMAPHSNTNYAFYRTGTVHTDAGRIPVGQITMGTGHASIKASAKDTVAHYDNTGSVVADVVAGEDAYGIWVAGLLRPNVTEEQATALAAAALSGDWRRTANGLELVAALAVNVPGFPIPRSALAASATVEGEDGQRLDDIEIQEEDVDALYGVNVVKRKDAVTAGLLPNPEEIAGIVRTAVEEYRAAEVREVRLAALSPFIEKARENSLTRLTTYFEGE